jgi:CBS-domain-containing membrane protein
MSNPIVTVTPETDVSDCCKTLEENQIRRAPVVDENDACCGMVSQSDIARHASEHEVAEVVREVSRPTQEASRVG